MTWTVAKHHSLRDSQVEDGFEGSETEGGETNWKAVPVIEVRSRACAKPETWKKGVGSERDGKGRNYRNSVCSVKKYRFESFPSVWPGEGQE